MTRALTPTALMTVWFALSNPVWAANKYPGPYFVYDTADQEVPSTLLGNTEYYDGDLVSGPDGFLAAWLEFEPDKGDRLVCAELNEDGTVGNILARTEPGCYAYPTLTSTANGQRWLSYETGQQNQWNICLRPVTGKRLTNDASYVTAGEAPDINHRVAAAPDNSLWIVWQGTHNGQFDILARRVVADQQSAVYTISNNPACNEWQPDVAVTPDGTIVVVWDGYDGESYNVYARFWTNNKWGEVFTVADTPAFEGYTRVTSDPQGRIWVMWEEGAQNWGKRYISQMRLKEPNSMSISDACGPLHRFRQLRLALLDVNGTIRSVDPPLPMPAIAAAKNREHARPDRESMGAFYERGELTVDRKGRLWLAYRHFYTPWLGVEHVTHVEEGWGLYARCFEGDGWSELYRFDIGQGDGMQRLSIAPQGDGIAMFYTTGRTDRRPDERPRGMVYAAVNRQAGEPCRPSSVMPRQAQKTNTPPGQSGPQNAKTTVAGQDYELFFGDLHRHTDLSLCFSAVDGTVRDHYRYAMDCGKLDFLGITDHCRDIAKGNALSQLWWRNTKEVDRHDLKPIFFPYYSYERSRGGEDHNVISLRRDLLRPYTYPHADFWNELDNDTLTIPHQTITQPITDPAVMPWGLDRNTWEVNDPVHRPLLEIYQGCRDRSIERDAHAGLAKRYLLGFIASSDHLSTGGSYAGVWAKQRSRESIFRAMQARRTFGATVPIRLAVRAGDHWMGEHFEAKTFPPLVIEATADAPFQSVELIVDGETAKTIPQTDATIRILCDPEISDPGFHYAYVRLTQADGNRAWSSPIWVDIAR